MEYMQNQMDNLIIDSEHYYVAFCDELDKKIQSFIDEDRYTGSVGCAENQRQDKIRTVEFSEFFS